MSDSTSANHLEMDVWLALSIVLVTRQVYNVTQCYPSQLRRAFSFLETFTERGRQGHWSMGERRKVRQTGGERQRKRIIIISLLRSLDKYFVTLFHCPVFELWFEAWFFVININMRLKKEQLYLCNLVPSRWSWYLKDRLVRSVLTFRNESPNSTVGHEPALLQPWRLDWQAAQSSAGKWWTQVKAQDENDERVVVLRPCWCEDLIHIITAILTLWTLGKTRLLHSTTDKEPLHPNSHSLILYTRIQW